MKAARMETPEENASQEAQEPTSSYSGYSNEGLGFCPIKDLNLPTSYDEVVTRFRKLQGERAVEVFN
ncbi:MAG: hypothetical protein JST41_04150 [Bacteroidetes bacterium]|nr:hypothetical protein [Bacteroidota bacterium]MBX7129235.1 hypothetical protein [Flavobacteriales bacterium]MCC6655713.1 hypothetical protein [Flavobacteriales bacterium]HMU14858.1 hypothetical protein [Flavobacteriales bacterium]HNA33287.1 hypothetical protein [Flavobacteriales bacterium]